MKRINKISKISLAVCMACCVLGVNAQSKKKDNRVPVKFQLVDEKGNPLDDIQIVVGEGLQHIDTDKNGFVSFKMKMTDVVTISEKGYETAVYHFTDLSQQNKIVLKRSLLFASESDKISLPFAVTDKRSQTGNNVVISGEDLRRYPSLDFRNALTALAPGLIVTENHGATGLADDKVGLSMRGGAPIYFLDDLPIDINEFTVNAEEVESVTIITDPVEKAMYGPRGANGIVYIKTLRGKANERKLSLNIEKGVQIVDRMPGVASGADYARLNNMARVNSGMEPLYSEEAIAGYAMNNPFDLKYPSSNFNDLMFKDIKRYDKYSLSSLGGNDFAQYYTSLAYTGEGDNFAIGDNADFNNITLRSNVDIKLNDVVSANMGIFGGLTIRNSPRYASSDNNTVEFNTALNDARNVIPIAFPVYLPMETTVGHPVYGVSSAFKTNPIANLEGGGYHQERGRNGSVYAALNFNLDKITKGLSMRGYINFTAYNLTRIGKKNAFESRIYDQGVEGENGVVEYPINTDWSVPGSESKMSDYYYQNMAGYGQISYDRVFGDHGVKADAVYYLSKFTRKGIEDPYKEQNLSVFGSYSFKNRYYVNAAVSYSGSQALQGPNQYKAFPSVGAGWIISDEAFMENVEFLDFLKLRGEYGVLGFTTDNPAMRQYENQWVKNEAVVFGPFGETSAWQGAQGTMKYYNTYYGKWKNPELDWQTRKELSVGLDANLLNNRLSVSATYYYSKHQNIQGKAEHIYPLMSGLLANPTINFEETDYYGAEISARFSDKIGDFGYSLGGWVAMNRNKRVKYDERNYRESESYLRREGKSTDVIYGYVYEGRFETDEEAQSVVQYHDETLLAGDFKYKDINGDGIIDSKDQVVIGNSAPKAYYALNLALYYKNFELHVTADGKAGFDYIMSNDYYRDGTGDNNYSQYIVDKVDAGEYPRLTYTKINNNFFNSAFWLQKRDYFKIQNIELAYNFKLQAKRENALRNIRLFVRAANVLTLTGVEGVDPENVNSGITTYPLNRTVTGGLSLTF